MTPRRAGNSSHRTRLANRTEQAASLRSVPILIVMQPMKEPTMKGNITAGVVVAIVSLLIPVAAFAAADQTPAVSSTCQITSRPGGKDGSTVEYSWKITAKTREDRVLSVDHLTRDPKLGVRGVTRHFEYCKPGSTHEQEIVFKVGRTPDDGGKKGWFEGLVQNPNLDVALPESAVVSVTTRQISGDDGPGHLISITVSNKGREICRHFIFINFISPADLQRLLPSELGAHEREPRDGNKWQIFTDPKSWKPTFRRFTELDKQDA